MKKTEVKKTEVKTAREEAAMTEEEFRIYREELEEALNEEAREHFMLFFNPA